jgi:hypothetical protein
MTDTFGMPHGELPPSTVASLMHPALAAGPVPAALAAVRCAVGLGFEAAQTAWSSPLDEYDVEFRAIQRDLPDSR